MTRTWAGELKRCCYNK